jgi:uncharacterized protein (TIGR03435 family)
MRIATVLIVGATAGVLAQTVAGPTFEVVSIKKHVAQPGPMGLSSSINVRPDGGIAMANIPVATLISRAYPSHVPADMAGLPAWAMSERYDVSATSTLSKSTADDRAAMMRAMLADRFKLVVHMEQREKEVYDLVLARSDGKLGSGLTPIDTDCAQHIAAQRAAFEANPPGPGSFPDLNAPPPPCTLRSVGLRPPASGSRMEGETTIENLTQMLRVSTGRFVIDKTKLPGSYRVNMLFDMFGARRPPEIAPPPDAPANVFTAVREQLGLKLESSRAMLDTLVIDRLDRPTEN